MFTRHVPDVQSIFIVLTSPRKLSLNTSEEAQIVTHVNYFFTVILKNDQVIE